MYVAKEIENVIELFQLDGGVDSLTALIVLTYGVLTAAKEYVKPSHRVRMTG